MDAWVYLKLIGSLALLMFGMKMMSESLQKMAGPQLRHVLGAMTTNRFTGVLAGIFVTAAVQSSTATALMTVSFVNAGLLTLMQAIAVIMGAHVGTTVTAWIMSLGFVFNIAPYVYPALFIAIILIYMKKRRIFGDFLFGVSFLFLGLSTLRDSGYSLMQDPEAGHQFLLLQFQRTHILELAALPRHGNAAHVMRAVECCHNGNNDDAVLYRRVAYRPGYHVGAGREHRNDHHL